MSARSVQYPRLAHADLASVSKYTKSEWGAAQRDPYLALLREGVARLIAFPELGEMRPELGDGVRSMGIEYHVVYYRATPKIIRVLRIRHLRSHPLTVSDL